MTNIATNPEAVSASSDDTIFVISPNIQLIQDVRDFCVSNNMNLWIGEPNSPDVIAVPYRVGIVDKEWLGEKSWLDWIDFLRETKGESHDHLLLIILPPPLSEAALDEVRREFEDGHEPVHFMFGDHGSHVVKIIRKWLDTDSTESFSHVS